MSSRKANKRTWRGTEYRSDYEMEVAQRLDALKRRLKFKVGYETEEVGYQLPPPPPSKYTPDFHIKRKDGTEVFIEVKGYFDAKARRKMLLVKEQNPDLNIVLLFMQDNKLHRSAKMRYSEWAEKNGFDYAINEIKEEWLSG